MEGVGVGFAVAVLLGGVEVGGVFTPIGFVGFVGFVVPVPTGRALVPMTESDKE